MDEKVSQEEREKRKELFTLMRQNPELQALYMTDTEIIDADCIVLQNSSIENVGIEKYLIIGEEIIFKNNAEQSEIVERIIDSETFKTMTELEIDKIHKQLLWREVIVAKIKLPEVC